MQITEVRIKLMENDQDRLLGFCSITIDSSFVVRDLKIINGTRGPFIAMPSRKLSDRCPSCRGKNHLRSAYCSQCGGPLEADRSLKSADGKAKLYADIAHPINSECRDLIQNKVIEAYGQELIAAQQEGYICRYDDFGENDFGIELDMLDEELPPTDPSRKRRLDTPGSSNNSGPHASRNQQQANHHSSGFGDDLFT